MTVPRPDEPDEAAAAARYRVFAVLFALATVLYHRWKWFSPLLETLPLVAATLVLVKPSATWRLLLLAVLQSVFAYRDLPDANTNRTLMVFLSATIACAWPVAWRRAGGRPDAAAWLRAFEPALRAQLVVVYAWAFWHKLNADFFDVELSCAVELYLRVTERVAFVPWPTDAAALKAVAVGTVAVEGLLPVLLVIPRTRWMGLAVGAALHFGFGLTMFYDFSMTMLALLFLFAPPELARDLLELRGLSLRARLGLSPRAWTRLLTAGAVLFAAVTELVFWDMFDFFAVAWAIVPFAVGLVAWRIARRSWRWPPARELLRVPPALAVFPLLLFLDGASPYLGAKTETAFAMYSNLRTEGGRTNHLLVPRPLALFDYQTDLVVLESSSDRELADLATLGYPVPFYVLRRRVVELVEQGVEDVAITYTRDGEHRAVAAAEHDPELSDAPSYLERKLLRFRTILPMDANACSH